jgi:hypothetical protein
MLLYVSLDVKPHEKKVISLIGAHTEIQSLKVRFLKTLHLPPSLQCPFSHLTDLIFIIILVF